MARSPLLLLGLLALAAWTTGVSAGCVTMPSLFQADGQTTIAVKAKNGTIASKLCPGLTYSVHIQFPDLRTALVTATKGFFQGLGSTGTCPNHAAADTAVSSLDMQFSLSCAISGSAVLSIASKPPSATVYKWLNFSLPIAPLSACGGSTCVTGAVSTGVVRLIPAYGQCGGAGGNCCDYYCADQAYPGYACASASGVQWGCQRQSRWYYQCLPGGSSSNSSGSTNVVSGSTSVTGTSAAASLQLTLNPIADVIHNLGVLVNLGVDKKANFSLDVLNVPKAIDASAVLKVFAGLAALKNASSDVTVEAVSVLTTLKTLCGLVPASNSTEALAVAGMGKFLAIITDKVLPVVAAKEALATTVLGVLTSLGTAMTASTSLAAGGGVSLSNMLSVVTSFGSLLSLVKDANLL